MYLLRKCAHSAYHLKAKKKKKEWRTETLHPFRYVDVLLLSVSPFISKSGVHDNSYYSQAKSEYQLSLYPLLSHLIVIQEQTYYI